jgi:hypothetical protein
MRVGGDVGIGYTTLEELPLATSDGGPEIEGCRSGFRRSGERGKGDLFGVGEVTAEPAGSRREWTGSTSCSSRSRNGVQKYNA